MSTNIKDIAKKYLSVGFSVIPVNSNKNPAVDAWGKYVYSPMKVNEVDSIFGYAPEGIALLMGGKMKLTAIDVDIKYDITGELSTNLKSAIGKELLSKLCCHKTVNGGLHLIFSCEKVEGNQKLATRCTTEKEKLTSLFKSLGNNIHIDTALQTAISDNSRVLIETRGEGGYILVPPTPGYAHVYGKIQNISTSEYDLLLDTCRSFNTYTPQVKNYQLAKAQRVGEDRGNTFKNFNDNCDVLELLSSFGWEQAGASADGYVKVKRPGTSTPHSAYYNPTDKSFWVFTTSTVFECNKKYSPVDILLALKYNNDGGRLNELLQEIKELGY
jgi:hypothetical protein